MRAILLVVALAVSAGAQSVLPSDVKDPEQLRNLEYLLDQVNAPQATARASGGAAYLGAAQQFSGANTFTGNVDMSGGRTIYVSSMSLTTQTLLGTANFICYGTTVTHTPKGNFVLVRAKASGRTSGNGSFVDMAILKNGSFISPATQAIADSRLGSVSADSNNHGDLTFNKLVSVTPGVATTFCMAGKGTGTPNWYCDTAVCYLEISDP